MKIFYRIHIKKPKNSEYQLGPWVDATGYVSEEAAKIELINRLKSGLLTGRYDDYVIMPYNEPGQMLDKVELADAAAAAADVDLLMDRPAVRAATSAMLASRQLYTTAVQELERRISEAEIIGEDKKARPPHPLSVEVIIQSISAAGSEPFNMVELLEGFAGRVMPWFKDVVTRQSKAEMQARVEESKKAFEARNALKIPIGIASEKCQEPAELARGTSLVLVGYGPAVRFLLGWAVSNVLTTRDDRHPNKLFGVIRFSEEAEAKTDNPQLALVGKKAWQFCMHSKTKFYEKWLPKELAPLMTGKATPDLLVVDDLAAASGQGLLAGIKAGGGLKPYVCADVHKLFTEFCAAYRFGLLAGIPSPDERPIDLAGGEWERLRSYAVIRPVTVIRKACKGHEDLPADKVRLVVGRDAFQLDVEPAAVEPVSKIIV